MDAPSIWYQDLKFPRRPSLLFITSLIKDFNVVRLQLFLLICPQLLVLVCLIAE